MTGQSWFRVYESFSSSAGYINLYQGLTCYIDLFPISLLQRLLSHRLGRLPSWGHTEDGSTRGGEEACIEDAAPFKFAITHRSAQNL